MGMGVHSGEITEEHKGTLGVTRHGHNLDCSEGFMAVHVLKLIKS